MFTAVRPRDGDEDTLVEPVQVRCSGFNVCRCMAEALARLSVAVANTA